MTQFTFALIKSKAIRRNLHPIVLARILEAGFTIYRAQWCKLAPEIVEDFYHEHLGRPYWDDLARSVSGHVIALVLLKDNAVESWRALMGATDPRKAAAGTLRTLAADETVLAHNVVHGSDSAENAAREIKLIFGHRVWYKMIVDVGGVAGVAIGPKTEE